MRGCIAISGYQDAFKDFYIFFFSFFFFIRGGGGGGWEGISLTSLMEYIIFVHKKKITWFGAHLLN